uniref:Glycine-rich protein n=2 Tax=Lychas mucronatus TaxID=172552 RepID=NDBG1_LYCMC|nr:RecName: Full=Glycine-rich protein; Flags: Precursor [Lychas mucronatus]ABY26696.1 NDBP4 [Lychas mucronatus]
MKSMIAVLLLALVATSMAGYLGLGYGGLYGAYGGLYGAGVPVGRAVAYSSSIRHPGFGGLGVLGGYGGYGYGLGLGAYGYGGYGLGYGLGLGLGHGKIW